MLNKVPKKVIPIVIGLTIGAVAGTYTSNIITKKQYSKSKPQDHQQINISIPNLSKPQYSKTQIDEVQNLEQDQNIKLKENDKINQYEVKDQKQSKEESSKILILTQEESSGKELKHQQKDNFKDQEQKSKSKILPINFTKIADIPEFNLNEKVPDDQFALVVIDMPYTPKFEQEIINKLKNTIKVRKSEKDVKIYRLKLESEQTLKKVKQIHGADIKEQTILLLKNPYEQNHNMINFNFDMYVQYPHLINIYLSDLQIINEKNLYSKFETRLKQMPDSETFLLMLCDSQKNQQCLRKRLTAKYIQMELGLHKLEGMKLFLIDEKVARASGLLKNAKSSGLHLIRKKNSFTFANPNRWLFDDVPFHVLQNINLYDKKREIMIPKYLSKIQTFNSMNINAPYVCSVVIDRNKIQPWQEQKILKTFAQMKQNQVFPYLSYVLKFGEIQYSGKDEDQFRNKKWLVKVANLEAIDRQILVHEAHSKQDLQKIGVEQENWQKNSFQYIYRYPEITERDLIQFINNVIEGKQQQYYKSQKKIKLQNLQRETAETFNEHVICKLDQTSHLVFQYSDHCSSCQMLSPGMQYLADVFKLFPDLKTTFHAINCDKNRIQGQPYSPFTPNIYYYSRNWKNKWPLRYPIIDNINQTGIKGLYDFCQISEQLKTVNIAQFNKHIKAVKNCFFEDLYNL